MITRKEARNTRHEGKKTGRQKGRKEGRMD